MELFSCMYQFMVCGIITNDAYMRYNLFVYAKGAK